jgi:hypothetical protein
MHLQKIILQSSVYSDMFRHYNIIFRENAPSLKPIEVGWITLINVIAFSTFCCCYQLIYDTASENEYQVFLLG